MQPEFIAAFMFAALFLGIFSGHPLGFVLGGVGVLFQFIFSTLVDGMALSASMGLFATTTWRVMNDFVLMAVPLFIFMAQLLNASGVAEGLFDAVHMVLGPVRGGLGLAVILVCTVFAASAGVVGATEVAVGMMAIPALLKRKYDIPLTAGAICAGGTLGIIIPPSIMLVFYASLANLSAGQLFVAAFSPGLLLAFAYMAYIAIRCFITPELGPPMPVEERNHSLNEIIVTLSKNLLPPVFLVLMVLGSIIAGVATPTEAAGLGCLGSFILAVVYKKVNLELIKSAAINTLKTTSMIYCLAIGGACFQSTFLMLECGDAITGFLTCIENPYLVLVLMMGTVFLLGMFIDWVGILLITVPIFAPVVEELGFDPVWFAILVAINLQMAFLTPPFGYSMFYLKGISPDEITMPLIYKGVVPFICLQWAVLITCMVFPDVIMWLPRMIF